MADPNVTWRDASRLVRSMKHHALRTVRIVGGVVLVIVGIIGCVVPILQGILLIVLGLGLLSVDIPAVRRWRERLVAWRRANAAPDKEDRT